MSEYAALPKRETYPRISSDDTLVVVLRDHITMGATPVLYVKAKRATRIRVDASRDLDPRTGIRVQDWTTGAGETITVTVDGSPTVFTEGAQFTASVSNVVTALSIVAGINTLLGPAGTGVLTASVDVNGVDVYIEPAFGVEEITLASSDLPAWSPAPLTTFGATQDLVAQETVAVDLPIGTFDPLNRVAFLRVLRGEVSADLRSPIPCRTYLKQPGEPFGTAALKATTGHPGGWPTSPSPPAP
jgi:hypothetical protein